MSEVNEDHITELINQILETMLFDKWQVFVKNTDKE